ncbi:hypothetical protein ACFQ9Y_05770 [Peribacillus simplex]|uniref:transketolase-like TK C-terminal-containing protein n=1 Tax=Peribacillus simplex TaxID=1478 RepID=UPI003671F811
MLSFNFICIFDRFEKQSADYKNMILPSHIKAHLAIEMGVSIGWREYIRENGAKITNDQYGASAPAQKLMEEFGFTVENIVKTFKELIL